MRKSAMAVLAALVLAAAASPVAAQSGSQPQIVIAPPPLAYPDYAEGQQGRFGVTYLNVQVDDFELDGLGFSVNERNAKLDENEMGSAVGLLFNMFVLAGGDGGTDVQSVGLGFGANLEREVAKGEGSSFVLFGGGSFNYANTYVDMGFADAYVDTLLLGLQAGGQYNVDTNGFTVSPYFTYLVQSGTADTEVNVYTPCCSSTSSSEDVSVTSTVLGIDVLHIASGVTLSGLMQQATSDDSDADVLILQVSWAFGEGIPSDKSSPSVDVQRQ